MFYLNLENQIHLLIIIVFSSYIYFSTFALKQPLSFAKYFGTAFFTPLILCFMSFLSLNKEHASSYLFFSEFILITALLFILLVEKSGDFSLFVFFLLYALPLGVVLLNLNFNSFNRSSIFDLILSLYLGIIVIIILSCIFLKRYRRINLYLGLFLVSVSLLIVQVTSGSNALTLALLLKALGYILFSYFLYRLTYLQLENDNYSKTSQLNRINQSLQQEVTRRVEEIERSNRILAEKNKIDGLTGAYNKKATLDYIDNSISKKTNKEFSILLLDVDNFKQINDTYGHITGDKCLKNLVSIARNSIRGEDILGRFGGDEFIIIMHETNPVQAYLVAERFRKKVESATDPHYTISIGIASYPSDAGNAKDLIKVVDKALYISKEEGRNKVSLSGQK
ncbi:MAG: GGDEF domain-containing protein [Ruminiclostridium sp.]|nr:GGDEF domain-containing protein [Ruminiclostridium sp.]